MKTFLSIGSGPGIGLDTAIRFAREGYRVILTSRNKALLQIVGGDKLIIPFC